MFEWNYLRSFSLFNVHPHHFETSNSSPSQAFELLEIGSFSIFVFKAVIIIYYGHI